MLPFALNQMVAPQLPIREFINLAAALGCVGVELRNDLMAKNVSSKPFLDGDSPQKIGQFAQEKNIKILGLSEVYGFNYWSDAIQKEVEKLVSAAAQSGAESISLIPDNSAAINDQSERVDRLCQALEKIKPLLTGTKIIALIEPLGFSTASLQLKSDAMEAIKNVDGMANFSLVHDSFHHFLTQESAIYPQQTGIVHISGVDDATLSPEAMMDEARALIGEIDRLNSISQIQSLIQSGYKGAFSFEPFSPQIHQERDIKGALAASMRHISSKVHGH